MLVLSRKVGERVLIGGSVIVTIVATQGRTVKIGIKAPADVGDFREELIGQAGKHAEAVLGRRCLVWRTGYTSRGCGPRADAE
jgi:carbon storage regulator CsrA